MGFFGYLLVLSTIGLAAADDDVAKKLLVAGNRQFTSKLFHAVAASSPGKSIVMSGYSALNPLAQLGLGSVGTTHEEILKVIGMPNDEAIKESFATVNKELRSSDGAVLMVANAVYIPEKKELNETYAQMSREVFDSDVKNIDFSKSADAADKINAWVEDHTNKRIKDLVRKEDFDSSTQAVFVNAVYFKGKWVEKFNKLWTNDRDFHVSKDKTIQVPIMYQHGRFNYAHSDDLKAKLLQLFYEGGSSIVFVLPDEIDGLLALEEKLQDSSKLENAVSKLEELPCDISIPRFTVSTTIDLKGVLQKVGVESLFTSNAKLDYVLKSEGGLSVSGAIQKAFIEVNEEGVEAAAASEFGLVGAVGPGWTKEFVADRPFYWQLRSGDIALFTGVFYG